MIRLSAMADLERNTLAFYRDAKKCPDDCCHPERVAKDPLRFGRARYLRWGSFAVASSEPLCRRCTFRPDLRSGAQRAPVPPSASSRPTSMLAYAMRRYITPASHPPFVAYSYRLPGSFLLQRTTSRSFRAQDDTLRDLFTASGSHKYYVAIASRTRATRIESMSGFRPR